MAGKKRLMKKLARKMSSMDHTLSVSLSEKLSGLDFNWALLVLCIIAPPVAVCKKKEGFGFVSVCTERMECWSGLQCSTKG